MNLHQLERYELKAGHSGRHVLALKELLYTKLEVMRAVPGTQRSEIRPYRTDKYDDITEKAVSFFQKQVGLPVTGVVDPRTWTAIAAHSPLPQVLTHIRHDPTLRTLLGTALPSASASAMWSPGTHDKFVDDAYPRLSFDEREHIKRGSRSIDLKHGIPKTLWESEAYLHAMTPGKKVNEMRSVEDARRWAMREAQKWIDLQGYRAGVIQKRYHKAREGKLDPDALFKLGEGAHTLMDDTSPAHRSFKVYATKKYKIALLLYPVPAAIWFGTDMLIHSIEEGNDPTGEEQQETVKRLRDYFGNAFGADALKRAVG